MARAFSDDVGMRVVKLDGRSFGRAGRGEVRRRDNKGWLGREDSNLRMAVPKAESDLWCINC